VQDYRDYEDLQSQHFKKTTHCDHVVSHAEAHINGRSSATIFYLQPWIARIIHQSKCPKEGNSVHEPMVANPTSEGQAKDLHPR
jgi:hypothetical protein